MQRGIVGGRNLRREIAPWLMKKSGICPLLKLKKKAKLGPRTEGGKKGKGVTIHIGVGEVPRRQEKRGWFFVL